MFTEKVTFRGYSSLDTIIMSQTAKQNRQQFFFFLNYLEVIHRTMFL